MRGKKSFLIGVDNVVVDERYEVTHMIGCGAYGVVYSAKDLKTNEDVAIKKIQTAFDSVVDAKRILREIKILSKSQSDFLNTMCFHYYRVLRPRKYCSTGRHPKATSWDNI